MPPNDQPKVSPSEARQSMERQLRDAGYSREKASEKATEAARRAANTDANRR